MNAKTPPPVLVGTRLLAYAFVDRSITHAGTTTLFVDGKQIGAVPCLAITQERTGAVLLFFCDELWNPIGVVECKSFSAAQKRAESEYEGLANRWIIAGVSEDEAARYVQDQGKELQCSFCGKTPERIKHLISGSSANICDECIGDFYHELQKDKK